MIRRDFIKSLSLLMAPMPFVSGLAKAAEKGEDQLMNEQLSVHLVIDRRYVNAAQQIPKFISKVDKLHAIDKGMSGDFLQPLLDGWNIKSIVTVGITLSAEFFILKTLAQEQGYTVDLESKATEISKYGDLVMWRLVPDTHVITHV